MPLDEKTLLKKMSEDLGDPEVLAELHRLKRREHTLNQHQRWALKRLREKRWSDRFSEGKLTFDAGFAVLEANLLTSGSSSADVIRKRSKTLIRRIAKKDTLAHTHRPQMARELVSVLCDGLEHPSCPIRLISASGFLSLSIAHAFRNDVTELATATKALVRSINEDVNEGVAIEASRQLWLLMRAHAHQPLQEHITLARPKPHPHILFFVECARACIKNAALTSSNQDEHAPEWPELSTPLPNISMAYTLYDNDHDTSTTCSFAQTHPPLDTKPKETTFSRCGVCSSPRAVVIYAQSHTHSGGRESEWEHKCETCGCFTQGRVWERLD